MCSLRAPSVLPLRSLGSQSTACTVRVHCACLCLCCRYRMALDQIPNTGREIRYKIMRNIGNSFVRLAVPMRSIAIRYILMAEGYFFCS